MADRMTDAELQQIRARLEAATPGPWQLWTSCSWRRFGSEGTSTTVCEPITQSDGQPDLHFRNGGSDGPDAEFLAHSWESVRLLLDEVERLRTEVERLRELAEWNGCTPRGGGDVL